MIEAVMDQLKSMFQTHMEAELSALASPNGGVALTLAVPAKYHLGFDESSEIIKTAPTTLIIPGTTTEQPLVGSGFLTDNIHSIAVCHFLKCHNIENLQRMKSRYAVATRNIIVKRSDADDVTIDKGCIGRCYDVEMSYLTRKVNDEDQISYVASVWIMFKAEERETL